MLHAININPLMIITVAATVAISKNKPNPSHGVPVPKGDGHPAIGSLLRASSLTLSLAVDFSELFIGQHLTEPMLWVPVGLGDNALLTPCTPPSFPKLVHCAE